MKWVILLVLLSSSCFALSVSNMTHTSSVENNFVILLPLTSLSYDSVNHTSSYYGLLKISTPLNTLNISLNNHTSENYVLLKINTPLTKLSIENKTHGAYSNRLTLNVTELNLTRLVKNNSKFYTEFIRSMNSTTPIIIGNENVGIYPFDASVKSSNGVIYVNGNGIEGEISGLRYVKQNIDLLAHNDISLMLDGVDGLSVYDYMHTNENAKWFNTDTPEFFSIVNKSLFGKVSTSIINVKTNDGVLLRALFIQPKNSEKFINYTQNITLPVVFARGLWSNLYVWQDFGVSMADSGRRVYLIEITGGPGQDCLTCVNYDFDDLTLEYWPALIGTIQTLENSSIQYVGHSNGARTGISSLEIYNDIGKANAGSFFNGSEWVNVSMSAHPVDTYIAVGMPGAFDGVNPVTSGIKILGNSINEKIENNNLTHVTLFQLGEFGLTSIKLASENKDDKISVGLWNDYYSWMQLENDSQPGQNVNLSNFLIMQGDILITSDQIVSTKDEELIYSNINSQNKAYISLPRTHTGVADSKESKRIIKSYLYNKNLEDVKINFTFQNITNRIYGGVIINETK